MTTRGPTIAESAGRSLPSEVARVIEKIRPALADQNQPTSLRIRLLWSAVKVARNVAEPDDLRRAAMSLCLEVKLIDRNGRWVPRDVRDSVRRYGADDIAHLITWALRGWNPFDTGPLE